MKFSMFAKIAVIAVLDIFCLAMFAAIFGILCLAVEACIC